VKDPLDVRCDRPDCGAKAGEPCKSIPSYDGLKDYDQELAIARFHQARLWRARGQCGLCKSNLSEGVCPNESCPGWHEPTFDAGTGVNIASDHDYFLLVDDGVKDAVRAKVPGEPLVWSCPCGESGCHSRVFYGRSVDGHVYFMANMARDPTKHFLHRIDNVEDFQDMMDDEVVLEADKMLFAMWLNMGLREALLSAPAPAPEVLS